MSGGVFFRGGGADLGAGQACCLGVVFENLNWGMVRFLAIFSFLSNFHANFLKFFF